MKMQEGIKKKKKRIMLTRTMARNKEGKLKEKDAKKKENLVALYFFHFCITFEMK